MPRRFSAAVTLLVELLDLHRMTFPMIGRTFARLRAQGVTWCVIRSTIPKSCLDEGEKYIPENIRLGAKTLILEITLPIMVLSMAEPHIRLA